MLLLKNIDSDFITIIVKHSSLSQYQLQAAQSMHLKNYPQAKILSLITILVLVISPMFLAQASGFQLTTTSEYKSYVHTYVNSAQGNYTLVEKPIFPVMINNSQIQIGADWTIICPLQAGPQLPRLLLRHMGKHFICRKNRLRHLRL